MIAVWLVTATGGDVGLSRTILAMSFGAAALGLAAAGGYVGATRLLPYLTGWSGLIIMLVVWFGGYMAVRALKSKPGINYIALFGFTFLCGVVFAPVFYLAIHMAGGEPTILLQAIVITGTMITALTGYVLLTKKDFSFMAGALSIAFFGLLALFVIGLFTSSWGFHLLFAGGGALFFAAFVLFDTSRIVRTHPVSDSVGAAVDLFVDFFGLFIYVLQFLMLLAGGRD